MARPRPNLFAVISWGNAGTQWLAKLLNAHPDVFCVHNLRNKLEPRGGPAMNPWVRWLRRRAEGSSDYLWIVRREGRHYALAGDVHGVPLRDVDALRASYGDKIRFAALTRHPVLRVRSHLNLARRTGTRKQLIRYRALRRSLPPDLRPLLDTRERLFFAHALALVCGITEEWQVGPVFTLEGLTQEPASVDALLDHLSQGTLRFPPAVLETAAAGRVAPHTPSDRTQEPAAAFAELEDWQQEAFRRLLSPEARSLYEKLGYDLHFV